LSAASIAGTLKQQPGKHFDTLSPPFIALSQPKFIGRDIIQIRFGAKIESGVDRL
jgi:hypothetical protein